MRGAQVRRIGAAGAAILFVLVGVLVRAGRLERVDLDARRWFWPSGDWGRSQGLETLVLIVLQPTAAAVLFALAAAWVGWRRRTWRPVVGAVALIVTATGAVVALKHLFAVPDTHGSTAQLGGSFPSGHMVAIICFAGGLVLLRERRRARDGVAVGALAVLVAVCLLFTAVHWLTDVVGGTLVGLCLLLGAGELPLWAATRSEGRTC